MTPGRRLPAIAPDIELADFDTEIVALIPDVRRAVHLDAGHAIVLDSCRRGDTIGQVVDDIALASGEERTAVEAWVGDALRELARLGLVVAAGVTDDPTPSDAVVPDVPARASHEGGPIASGRDEPGTRDSAR